jgi:predicted nucleotidyltransferase
MLEDEPSWLSVERESTRSVAWGDIDSDGDLDLAVGNSGSSGLSNQFYRNDNGYLNTAVFWSSLESDKTLSIALGDMDGDSDLDMAVGNHQQPLRLYRNDNGVLTAAIVKTLPEQERSNCQAWGDFDNDGDLDLIVGNYGANRLYINQSGTLTSHWVTPESDYTLSCAWGDVDNDGDLDLAIGNYYHNRLYINQNGSLSLSYTMAEDEPTHSIAWGDIDNDNDLDLVTGNKLYPNRIYRNQDGVLSSFWTTPEADKTSSVAWGDVDGDGDLDLAVGNDGEPNRLYLNNSSIISFTLAWSSEEMDDTGSVAWGDVDGDGDIDLAAGNKDQPNRVYRNDNGMLTTQAVWSSIESDKTRSIAWADVNGDGWLELTAGNEAQPNRIYVNQVGSLKFHAAWSSQETYATRSIAWGDVDGDGDLDLVASNSGQETQIYTNQRGSSTDPAGIPLVAIETSAAANGHAHPTIWEEGTKAFTYTLYHPDNLKVGRIQGKFSLDGGGKWRTAIATSDTVTQSLQTRPYPEMTTNRYVYTWDIFNSGVMGQSDNVVFRLEALPDLHPREYSVSRSYQHGIYATQTTPFRVRGTQVRVISGTMPISNALVYRFPKGETTGGATLADKSGKPFQTDNQGFLQGRGIINAGDALVALAPITSTRVYTYYLTSARPTTEGLDINPITEEGIQTLKVLPEHPLYLFNLEVSLEWDARNDEPFMEQLKHDLKRASELLYDWTDGQVALGDTVIFHDREAWDFANIRVYATNRLRPNANKGGILTEPITDPVRLGLTYGPGLVRMGAHWNRYGDPNGTLGEDWPRTLAHELGHYLLFLEDNYVGLEDDGTVISVDGCQGAMTDPYVDNQGEFHPKQEWLPACEKTMSNRLTGRSDWETILTFYLDLHSPAAYNENPGPQDLPLELTQIHELGPDSPCEVIEVPILYLVDAEKKSIWPGNHTRAFIFQREGHRLIDLGRTVKDRVEVDGARPGDTVCVYDPDAQRIGCEEISINDQHLTLSPLTHSWNPDIIVTPVTSSTVTLAVEQIESGLDVYARLYPVSGDAPPIIKLVETTGQYIGSITLEEPSFEGYIRVWVDEEQPRREIVTDYSIGGNPGRSRHHVSLGELGRSRHHVPWGEPGRSRHHAPYGEPGRSRHHVPRGEPGRSRHHAPVVSTDGQVVIYGTDIEFAEGEFYAIQSTSVRNVPAWATAVGQAYRVTATANAPQLENNMSVSIGYMSREVPDGEEPWINVWFWEENPDLCGIWSAPCWRPLKTNLDTKQNMASAMTQGPGVYALMSSITIPLEREDWNFKGYPVPGTTPITKALRSIEGCYDIVYDYQETETDPTQMWKRYIVELPDEFNTLKELQFGEGYWIRATRPVTLYLKGSTETLLLQEALQTTPLPPAPYYGTVHASEKFTPTVGMLVQAKVGNQVCGQSNLRDIDGQLMYVVDVNSSDADRACGAQGAEVTFSVGGQELPMTAIWDNTRLHQLDLSTTKEVYLPVVKR